MTDEDFFNKKSRATRWDRLSDEQKEEYKNKAAEKRREIAIANVKKELDIKRGKQKTLFNSW